MKRLILGLLLLAGVIILANCEGTTFFSSHDGVFNSGVNDGDIITDSDGNTGIDSDGDGLVDIPVDNPGSDSPLRDPVSGDCNIPGSTKYLSLTESLTITAADMGSNENLWVKLSSNGETVTIDMVGRALKRIIVTHSGGNNTVEVKNAVMVTGFCNEGLTGGGNQEILFATSSAPLVDLQASGGNHNNLDTLFVPMDGLRYELKGNNNCVSAPPGTTILFADAAANKHRELFDGSTCF